MKIFFSEYKADYSKYNFPYQVYAVKESSDSNLDFYEKGFLPTRIHKDLFYLARSLRINLNKFTPNTENRRIFRKTDYLSYEIYPLNEFTYHYEIGKMAVDFSKERFHGTKFTQQSVKKLFKESSMTHVLEFSDKTVDEKIGYALCLLEEKSIMHYSYPFYNTSYFDRNLGMGMMLNAINYAKMNLMNYVYIGTCYTKESLYKLQFDGAEYYNGFKWDFDIDNLKKLIASPPEEHLFKDLNDKDLFIKQILNEK